MPASNGNGRLLPTLLGKILAFVDAPWKAITVIVVLVLGGAGWAAWHERTWLKEALVHATPLSLKPDAGGDLAELLEDTTADLITLWSANLYDNSARFRAAVKRGDGEPWTFSPRTLPIIGPSTPGPRMARILAGSGTCELTADIAEAGPLAARLLADGYVYFCIEPSPPSNDRALIALIGMAWRKQPPPAEAQGALIAAAKVAWDILR